MKPLLLVIVLLSSGCAWSQREADFVIGNYEVAVSAGAQADLAQDMLALIIARYPSANKNFRFRPAGPLGRSVASSLREMGYGVSPVPGGSSLLYSLEFCNRHGLHLSLQVDDWHVIRFYRENRSTVSRPSHEPAIQGSERFANIAAAMPMAAAIPVARRAPPQQQFTRVLAQQAPVTAVGSPPPRPKMRTVRRWAVQVIAGQQLQVLAQVREALIAAGYSVDVVEKPELALHAVQIVGMLTRAAAQKVLRAQRVGGFKDAFLIEYQEQRPVARFESNDLSAINAADASADSITAPVAQPEASSTRCERVLMERGSLRENVRRLLDRCGYAIGNWQVGTDGYVADWIIQRPYDVTVREGLSGVLALLRYNYFVEGQVRPFTQTIDFKSVEGPS